MFATDELERMQLAGYVRLTAHGFALPAYRAEPGANAWYVAIPVIEGDHTSPIAGFELLEEEEIIPLRDTTITVGPSDPWQDVFLWAGRVFAGPPSQILDAVAVYRDELQAFAPLSYLDLAIAAESPASADLAATTLAFLETRLGGVSGATTFRELVLRPAVLIELRRQFRKINSSRIPDLFREFVVREYAPGEFEAEMAPGTAAGIGGPPAAAEFSASVARFGEIIGLPLRATGLDAGQPRPVFREAPVEKSPVELPYDVLGRPPSLGPVPNILLIATDRRAVQIAKYLEAPSEIALDSALIWRGSGYRIVHTRETGNVSIGSDPVFLVTDRIDSSTPLGAFGLVVWLAGNDALIDVRAEDILNAVRSIDPDTPFLIAPAPPADGPSTLLAREHVGSRLLQRCNAVIDTTLARSPFWAGQPRRSVDRRMADIVSSVSIVAALDSSLRKRLKTMRGAEQLYTLSFLGGPGRFDVEQATASELNTSGLDVEYESDAGNRTRVAFEMRDKAGKRAQNAFIELLPLRQDFERFAKAAFIEAVGRGVAWPESLQTTRIVEEPIRKTLDEPALAAAIYGPRSQNGPIVVTAEAPRISSLREAEANGAAIIRYTDILSLRLLVDRDQSGMLPAEIRLPSLHRFSRNRGLATRGVDARDVLRLPEEQWKEILGRNFGSELGGQARKYLPAIDPRGAGAEMVLPVPAVWNALNDGDTLAQGLLQWFPRIAERHDISGKRTGDLVTAWSRPAPGAQRWVIEDGKIPVELTSLEPDEVPAQRLFFIDGDGAVPTFLLSRLFSVWARALLPSSTSWASRFQVSKTFDAFPFPWSFLISPSENGSPPHLHFAEAAGPRELARIVGDNPGGLANLIGKGEPDEYALRRDPLMREIDALLLDDIKLPPHASDLDILENLIERNRDRT